MEGISYRDAFTVLYSGWENESSRHISHNSNSIILNGYINMGISVEVSDGRILWAYKAPPKSLSLREGANV